jgi:hypothetical protein
MFKITQPVRSFVKLLVIHMFRPMSWKALRTCIVHIEERVKQTEVLLLQMSGTVIIIIIIIIIIMFLSKLNNIKII